MIRRQSKLAILNKQASMNDKEQARLAKIGQEVERGFQEL
jgi:hypothetical protein